MKYFKEREELERVLGGFFMELTEYAPIKRRLLESGIVIRFTYHNPEWVVVIDCRKDPLEIRSMDTNTAAMVEMEMEADTAHEFWFGRVNLVAAIARGKMKPKGSIPKLLSLLPAIKPAYSLYPGYLEENGFGHLNILKKFKF